MGEATTTREYARRLPEFANYVTTISEDIATTS